MALTVEEKIKRLETMEDWEIYPPEQKTFLTLIAQNFDPEIAFSKVFPEKPITGAGSVGFHAKRWLRYKSIEKALAVIQYVKPEPEYTHSEAISDITWRLRKQGLEDETYIKLLGLMVKMKGWDKQKEPPKTPEEKDEDINKIILATEKKRREEG